MSIIFYHFDSQQLNVPDVTSPEICSAIFCHSRLKQALSYQIKNSLMRVCMYMKLYEFVRV